MQIPQESAGIRGSFGGHDPHKHPPCRAINGHEEIAPGGLIRHLRQVFHVEMQEAGLISLECPVRLCGRLGSQGIEIADPMAAQTAVQARARHIRVEEFTTNGQKIVQRQQQHPAQFDRHGFLRRGQRRRQLMSGVRAVLKAGPPPPAVNGVERHPVASRQHRSRLLAGRDLGPDRRGRCRVLVQR